MRLVGLITRQWRNRPGRALATAASVAVAVGAVVATWVSADASRAGYRRLLQAVEGVPTLDVVARAGGRFESESVPTLVDVPGVRAVVPLFFRPTLLRVGDRRVREIAVGVDAAALVDAGLLALVAGAPCREDDEVLLDATLAEGLGLGIGDEVLFFARRRIRRLRVSGLARPDSLRWFAEGAGVVVDIETLGEMSLADGLLDRVRVVLTPDAPRPRVLDAVARRLPEMLTAEVPAGRASLAEDVLHAANLGLDFVTGLTVAMAWFIVGNAMLMNVTERRRGISLVRVLGASGRQMRGLITAEAALLGGLGAAAGAVGGLLAARPIAAGIARALQTAAPELVVRPLVVGTSMALGIGVAVAAAWWPARLATRVDLLEGLAVAPAPAAGRISRRFVVGVLLLAAAALAGQGLVIAEVLPPRAAVPAGMSMLLVLVAATPLVLPPLVRLLGRLVPAPWRLEGHLAVEQILRQPVRTALTTGVLVVAVTNGIGLGHAIRDNVEDVLGWYGRMLKADWLLAHAGVMSAGGAAGVADARGAEEAARRLAGVAAVEGVGVAPARVAGGSCVVVARDVPDDRPLPLEPVNATEAEVRAALARGAAVAGTVLARRAGIAPGDELTVEVFGRTARVTVAALVVDYTAGGASLHLRRDVARRLFGMEAADMILVTAAPGGAAALREPLAAIAADHSMLLRSFGDARRVIDRMVSGIVGALWSILGLGFVVGSLGVANTVTMNVLEKRRALGLLRALGMRRRQVVRMVLIESLLLGAAGGLVGLFGGLTTALFIQTASQPLLGHPVAVSFRPGVVATNLAAGLLVTALAAWLPARRAVRLDILEAIAAE